ncbi:hypothetical protein DRN98_04885 [Methanosarcinales archaeon]|nr:MAG: hypothetical protein DRN98_04885 [Methanosarcinales archaeon]
MEGEIIDIFDPLYGGFGYDQKFPHPDFLDLLLLYSGRRGDDASRAAVITDARCDDGRGDMGS